MASEIKGLVAVKMLSIIDKLDDHIIIITETGRSFSETISFLAELKDEMEQLRLLYLKDIKHDLESLIGYNYTTLKSVIEPDC